MLCAALSQTVTAITAGTGEDNFSVDFKGEERMMGEMTGTFLIIFLLLRTWLLLLATSLLLDDVTRCIAGLRRLYITSCEMGVPPLVTF